MSMKMISITKLSEGYYIKTTQPVSHLCMSLMQY